MEIVRYRPGEAIRWLETGAGSIRKTAQAKGRSLVESRGSRPFLQNMATAATALVDLGKGAYADVLHNAAAQHEYALFEDRFEVGKTGAAKSYPYSDMKRIEVEGDRATVVLRNDRLVIKPYAHIVSGRARVPIGWSRNGIEVPFELLLEELAARAGVEIEDV